MGFTSRIAGVALALTLGAGAVPGCSDDPAPSFAWQTLLTDLPGAALSVWGSSSRDVYVVGADALDGTGPYALHYDGRAWQRINTTLRGGSLWWVHGVTREAVFMVGTDGIALRMNPSTRQVERMTTPGRATLFGVWGQSTNDVWAVGGDTTANTGVLWHYDGRAWSNVALPGDLGSRVILYKVWGSSANDVWAVGTNGATIRWDGRAWAQVNVPTTARGPLFTVHGAGAQRYAVGGNASAIVLEGDGQNGWRQAELLDAPRIAGVYAPASGAPVAVGNEGSVFLRRSGTWRLAARPPQTDLDFHATWVEPDTGAVWAVGGQVLATPLTNGIVMRFAQGAAGTPATVVNPPELTTCPNERGTLCTWAGTGVAGFNGDNRPLRESSIYWPVDMEFAPDGTAYVLDWNNHKIRRVTARGTFETVIGTDLPGDGPPDLGDLMEPGAPGTTVALNHPTDLLFQRDGRMLMVAWHNHKIRRFDPATGRVFVQMGRGPTPPGMPFMGDGVPWTAAANTLKQPGKAAFDAEQRNLYILDQGNGRIRRVDMATGMVSTIAGNGTRGFAGDNGPAAMAVFNWQAGENPEPEGGIAVGPDGNIYVADTGNHRIRRINVQATPMTIETIAGDGMHRYAGDGGPALMASLYSPQDIEFGPDGQLYVADSQNHRVRAIDLATGVIRTVAGNGSNGYSGDRGPATEAELWRPFGLAFDREGNLFISDTYNNRIRRLQLR